MKNKLIAAVVKALCEDLQAKIEAGYTYLYFSSGSGLSDDEYAGVLYDAGIYTEGIFRLEDDKAEKYIMELCKDVANETSWRFLNDSDWIQEYLNPEEADEWLECDEDRATELEKIAEKRMVEEALLACKIVGYRQDV